MSKIITISKSQRQKQKEIILKQIEITDRRIDKLVYELYGLTEEEIKIVEGGK